MTGMELVIPQTKEMAFGLPSQTLYFLEEAGEIARDVLDGRIAEWAEAGWTQRQMAEEIGCSQQTISKRLNRLGLKTTDPRSGKAGRKANTPPAYSSTDPDVIEAEEAEWEEVDVPERSSPRPRLVDASDRIEEVMQNLRQVPKSVGSDEAVGNVAYPKRKKYIKALDEAQARLATLREQAERVTGDLGR